MNPSRVVFCDFDGTITIQDTFIGVLEKFAPEIAVKLVPAIFERQITLKVTNTVDFGFDFGCSLSRDYKYMANIWLISQSVQD
ncbi:MAG: hypothetical protein ACFCU7_01225 [Pleurocapsa sp.]